MDDTKTQPTPEGNQLQPLQVLHCADGWIAVFKKSIHVGAGLDRYRSPTGTFVSLVGTPFDQRVLQQSFQTKRLTTYEVKALIGGVGAGKAAPWFPMNIGNASYRSRYAC